MTGLPGPERNCRLQKNFFPALNYSALNEWFRQRPWLRAILAGTPCPGVPERVPRVTTGAKPEVSAVSTGAYPGTRVRRP